MPGIVDDTPRYLTSEDVAAELQLDVKTVRTKFACGQIPGVKMFGRWYITRANLDRLMAGELP